MNSYVLIVFATIQFSLQFLFNQKYQQENGSSMSSALSFSIYKSAFIAALMLLLNGLRFEFTWFSFLIAGIYALTGVLGTYFTLISFSRINLSVYSVFAMMGGMILPVLYGTIFCREEYNAAKVICCALITVSLVLTLKSGKHSRSGYLCYSAVFILNGLAGVLSRIHQSSIYPHVDSQSYLVISSIISLIVCIILQLFTDKKLVSLGGRSLAYVAGYAVFNGIGNLFLLLALRVLPASVQYPIVTGGVIVCSTIISHIRKEKLRLQDYLSAAIAFAAAVIISL
jgi:drug/metabolite transporter (DMT)-like permease